MVLGVVEMEFSHLDGVRGLRGDSQVLDTLNEFIFNLSLQQSWKSREDAAR